MVEVIGKFHVLYSSRAKAQDVGQEWFGEWTVYEGQPSSAKEPVAVGRCETGRMNDPMGAATDAKREGVAFARARLESG